MPRGCRRPAPTPSAMPSCCRGKRASAIFLTVMCMSGSARAAASSITPTMREAGIRGRVSDGPMQGHDVKQPIDLADLETLKNDWAKYSNGGLLALGMAWRGHGGNLPSNAVPEATWRAEFEAAQRLGLPVS